MHQIILPLLLVVVGLISAPAYSFEMGGQALPSSDQAEQLPGADIDSAPRSKWRNEQYGGLDTPDLSKSEHLLQPFGVQLFEGGFTGNRSDDLNPQYRIMPGDQVILRVWGAVELDRIISVDANGNLFIPGIGPVSVAGQAHSQLNGTVERAIKSVYPENVEVYTHLKGVQPVSVYVTGFVNAPGRYSGTPSDSLLYYLVQAQGIDPLLGSYRHIDINRAGEQVASIDLYRFLLEGELPNIQFQDNDTIVVRERGPTINVLGDVDRDYRYELKGDALSGALLLELARTQPGVSHALLRGTRMAEPVSRYLTLAEFEDQALSAGDEVVFTKDARDESIVVQVEGSYYGPSRYVLPRNVRLKTLLDSVAVPRELTATHSISIRRESVAEQQRQSLEDSLRRLEASYLTASSSTDQEASIRTQEAELISKFVERARQIEPTGRMVVASNDEIANIRLRDGDVISIPEESDSVLLSGEIVMPRSVVFEPGKDISEYIAGAGGFSRNADTDQILLVRQNGAVVNANEGEVRPGDEILVLPKVQTKNLQLATSLTQIIYQVAIAAKVVLDL